MWKILISLAALIAAASLVTLANATMATVMPLRMLMNGGDETSVAYFGASYFLGFAVGCFSEPPRILRVGYIRAFAAAAAFCTALAIVIDMTSSPMLWIVLRFFMGLSIAAIFASVDGWINATTPDSMRGTVFSAYGWCVGASAVLGQLFLVAWDGLASGFVTLLALAFNAAVMLVALTRASAPAAAPSPTAEGDNPVRSGVLAITSPTAVVGAVYAGLATTAILSVLPAILSGLDVSESMIALVVAAFFIGRLILQIPMGMLADRMDLRALIGIIAAIMGGVTAVGMILTLTHVARIVDDAGLGSKLVFLGIMALLGGLILPLYTVANSLAFARAGGRPAVRIATTLLLVNSAGAVAGPLLVAATIPVLGQNALPAVVIAASAATAVFALWRRTTETGPEPAPGGLREVPATSLAMTETIAETREEERDELAAEASPRPS